MGKPKVQASSSRVAINPAASAAWGSFGGRYGAPTSSLSYLVEVPDTSSISNPNTVVTFKNLFKRDSTTKSRALEELENSLTSGDDAKSAIEDAVLEVWAAIYPRTSVDTSRRVRQLSHAVQGQLSLGVGKRMLKHMPVTVGAWLLGTHDSDSIVSSTARATLDAVFPTPEKQATLRTLYQEQLLDFCLNIINNESAQTLSDERIVSADEAIVKYSRTQLAAFGVITSLVISLAPKELEKHLGRYQSILASKNVWRLVSTSDLAVRGLHHLLRAWVAKPILADLIDLRQLSKNYIECGLESDLKGSRVAFLETLKALTKYHAKIWTESWTGKKPPHIRLRHFIRNGSQGSPSIFWSVFSNMLQALPSEVFPDTVQEVEHLVNSFSKGLTKKDEPKHYLASGLKELLHVIPKFSCRLSDQDQNYVQVSFVLPLVQSVLYPSDDSKWTLTAQQAATVTVELAQTRESSAVISQQWPDLSKKLVDEMKLSALEQSTPQAISQDTLGAMAGRWARMLSSLLSATTASEVLKSSALEVLQQAIEICKSRNGKPYGVAVGIDHIITHCRTFFLTDGGLQSTMEGIILNDLPELFLTPSAKPVASILKTFNDTAAFPAAWDSCLRKTIEEDDLSTKIGGFRQLIQAIPRKNISFKLSLHPEARALIMEYLGMALKGEENWDLFIDILRVSDGDNIEMEALEILANALVIPSLEAQNALTAFQNLSNAFPDKLNAFISTVTGRKFVLEVLKLTEAGEEELVLLANRLNFSLRNITSKAQESGLSVIQAVQSDLNEASANSVSVHTLIAQSQTLLETNDAKDIDSLLPNIDIWKSQLDSLLKGSSGYSNYITSPLSSAVLIIQNSSDNEKLDTKLVSRDLDGYPVPLRMAIYSAELLMDIQNLSMLDQAILEELLALLVMTTMLANDKLGRFESNALWATNTKETEQEMVEFVSRSQKFIQSCVEKSLDRWQDSERNSEYQFVERVIAKLYGVVDGGSSSAYYAAISYYRLVSEIVEIVGLSDQRKADVATELTSLRSQKQVLRATTYLCSHAKYLSSVVISGRWFNELLADLSSVDKQEANDKLHILLAMIRDQDEAFIAKAAHHRLVIFFRKLVSWIDVEEGKQPVDVLILSTLRHLAPSLVSVYGEHWEEIVNATSKLWSSTEMLEIENKASVDLPLLYESLELHAALRQMTNDEECNEDLTEALKAAESELHSGLLNLLSLERGESDQSNQPLRIFNGLVSRAFDYFPDNTISDLGSLYPLLLSGGLEIGGKAFDLLNSRIPQLQEKLSIDIAIERRVVRLPDELLSLILMEPKRTDDEREYYHGFEPESVLSFAWSWLLVFRHFTNGSQLLQSQYADCIKEGGYINPLLEFVVEVLGLSRGKPFDARGVQGWVDEGLTSRNFDETRLRRICAVLYYKSLKHVSSAVKTWWMECSSRVLVQSVVKWTEEYISPILRNDTMTAVQEWAAEQVDGSDEDDRAVVVRIVRSTREVFASYPIGAEDDNHQVSMIVTLPDAFPLQQAEVRSATDRTTFDERRWKGWLRSAQGVIAFNNNNLVDGLLAWRRNIVGALQGKEPCTICYSMVSDDGKLPSRKCKTCKNNFHVLCLTKWFASSGSKQCPLCRSDFAAMGRDGGR